MSQLPIQQPSILPPAAPGPRLVLYAQTHHRRDGTPISLLPLIINNTGVTHVIVGAFHVNETVGDIRLNNDPPDHEKHRQLWSEVQWLRGAGVKVLGMLGGAAKGTYSRLCGPSGMETYYPPLLRTLSSLPLDGVDLDIEEEVALGPVQTLIQRLHADLTAMVPNSANPATTVPKPPILTMAPVAPALLSMPHLSGFSYQHLHISPVSRLISWYNVQLYCGWGDASKTLWYDALVSAGWDPQKLVFGVVTNPGNGSGHVGVQTLTGVLRTLRARYPNFGGVMGWEYFNAGEERAGKANWEWAGELGQVVRSQPPVVAPPTAGPVVPPQAPAPVSVPAVPPARAPVAPLAQVSAQEMPMALSQEAEEKVGMLTVLGFSKPEAVAALNATKGDVELAAGLLFERM